MKLLSFSEALQATSSYSKRHLLLGNGFSISCKPNVFVYGKLFEQADFSALSPSAKKAFDSLQTQDFEKVIKALRDSASVLANYKNINSSTIEQLINDADGLGELLVKTIASSHPEWPGEILDTEYLAAASFTKHFGSIYTLNYDLLLYWSQMHSESPFTSINHDDGFRKPEDDFEASYVTWDSSNSHTQNTWFLHGALHLFDAGTEIRKYTWSNTGIRLIDQIREALSNGLFPIFVAEGTSNEKLTHIKHNDYLAKAYRSFSEIGGVLFIYGHSLAENDEHILKRIEKGKLSEVYVGIYGDPESRSNKQIISRAERLNIPSRRKPLKVSFYDAGSARVWGK